MALHSSRGEDVSPRQWAEWAHEKDMTTLHSETQIRLKELEVDVIKTDSRWNTLFILPRELLKLPVRILFAFAYVIGSFREDYEPGENFWKWMK